MKRMIYVVLAALVLGAGGLVWWLGPAAVQERVLAAIGRQPPKTAETGAPGRPGGSGRPSAPPSVEAAVVEVGAVSDEVEALGTLAANESVVIAAEISGRLTSLGFKEGDQIAKGQTLVELDPTILDQELKQARVDLGLAKDTYDRARELVGRGAGTRVAVEQTQAQYNAAEVRVGLAQARLERATITAPIEGVVGLRSVSVGNYITAGQTIITLADIDPIKVDFRVPELLLQRVGVGQKVQVRVDAFPDRTFEGEVYAIDPVVDVNGRAIRLRARIPNGDLALKPGLFARVTVVTDTRPAALIVPESAVVPDGTAKAVWVLSDDGRVKLNRVKIGKRLPGKVEVSEGLARGARVVVTGQMRLRENVEVKVAGPRAAAQAGIAR